MQNRGAESGKNIVMVWLYEPSVLFISLTRVGGRRIFRKWDITPLKNYRESYEFYGVCAVFSGFLGAFAKRVCSSIFELLARQIRLGEYVCKYDSRTRLINFVTFFSKVFVAEQAL